MPVSQKDQKKSGKGRTAGKQGDKAPRNRVRKAIDDVDRSKGDQSAQPGNGGAATTAEAPPKPETPPEQPKVNFAPIEDYLNRLMRGEQPEVTVVHAANALLDAIARLSYPVEVQIQALAYVLANHRYAKWSGEPTSANTFRFDEEVERSVMETGDDDAQWENVHDRLALLKARIKVEKPDELGQAKLAWEFLWSLSTRLERIHGFFHLLLEPLVEAKAPVQVVNNQGIPDEVYDWILWNHRRAIEKIEVALRPDIYETRTATGEAVLTILNGIENERDRAVVAGYAFELVRRSRTGPNIGGPMLHILELFSGFGRKPNEDGENPNGEDEAPDGQ